jgi:hypothetical protein
MATIGTAIPNVNEAGHRTGPCAAMSPAALPKFAIVHRCGGPHGVRALAKPGYLA